VILQVFLIRLVEAVQERNEFPFVETQVDKLVLHDEVLIIGIEPHCRHRAITFHMTLANDFRSSAGCNRRLHRSEFAGKISLTRKYAFRTRNEYSSAEDADIHS